MCGSFSIKYISQESTLLLPFSLMGEATKWLSELQRESITSLDELTKVFYERVFPHSKLVKLRDNI